MTDNPPPTTSSATPRKAASRPLSKTSTGRQSAGSGHRLALERMARRRAAALISLDARCYKSPVVDASGPIVEGGRVPSRPETPSLVSLGNYPDL